MKKQVNNVIFKNIGFFNYNDDLKTHIINNNYKLVEYDDATKTFLKNSYYTEFVSLMYSDIKDYSVLRIFYL